MKTTIQTKSLAATACGIFALAGMTANAQLLSSESFSGYTPGNQLDSGTSPAVAGYAGDWVHAGASFGTQDILVNSGSLNYAGAGYANGSGDSVGVPFNTTGGEIVAANSGRVARQLTSALSVTSSTVGTLYLSWLFQDGRETGATTYQMLSLYNGSPDVDNHVSFDAGLTSNGGQSGNIYDFGVGPANGVSNPTYSNTGVNADTGVHLFVVKFDLSAASASDSVTVWVDPTLGAGDPVGGTTVTGKDFQWNSLALSDYEGNSANWDEIRWGTTFDTVTIAPVPEPSTFALGGLGLAALLIFRRKKQA